MARIGHDLIITAIAAVLVALFGCVHLLPHRDSSPSFRPRSCLSLLQRIQLEAD